MVAEKPFKTRFCEKFRCRPGEYEERVLKLCMSWRVRLLAPLCQRLDPHIFDRDRTLIHDVGNARTRAAVEDDLGHYRFRTRSGEATIWDLLQIHISPRRLRRLANQLFPHLDRGRSSQPPPNRVDGAS